MDQKTPATWVVVDAQKRLEAISRLAEAGVPAGGIAFALAFSALSFTFAFGNWIAGRYSVQLGSRRILAVVGPCIAQPSASSGGMASIR